MRNAVMLLVLCAFATFASAVEGDADFTRTITEIGGSLTVGDGSLSDNIGFGGCFRTLQFFDPSRPSGFYYGFFLSAFMHSVGGVEIGDTRIVHLGWRSDLFAGLFGLDLCVAPVLGRRIVKNTVRGDWYVGVSPAAGFTLRVSGNLDLKFAFEPVVNLLNFGGDREVSNLSYSDLSVYVVIKDFFKRVKLDWEG